MDGFVTQAECLARWGVNSTTGHRKCLECKRLWNIEDRRRRRVDAGSGA